MKKFLNYKTLILGTVILVLYLWNKGPSIEWEKEIRWETLANADRDIIWGILSDAKFVRQVTDDSYIILGSKYGSLHLINFDSDQDVLTSKDLMIDNTSATAFHQLRNGEYLIAGYKYHPKGIWLAKLDIEAKIIWVKEYESEGKTQDVVAIESTGDGNYMLAGFIYPDSTGYTTSDYWVSKIDSDGELSWFKTFGGSDSDMAFLMRRINNGNFIIEGRTHSTDGDVKEKNDTRLPYSVWGIEINDQGELINSYRKPGGLFPTYSRYTGPLQPLHTGVITYTEDGEYLVFNEKWVGDEFDGSIDVYVEKFGADGYERGTNIIDSPGEDRAVAIDETNDGGCILLVRSETINDGTSFKLIKVSN